MPKNDQTYIAHMIQAAHEAIDLTTDVNQEDFLADRTMQLAVVRLLQEIGETAKRVSSSFRESSPEISWQKMISMRNFLVHQYLKVDYDIVWETAKTDLPSLVESLNKLSATKK